MAASFFVFFGNLYLVEYISHWCINFFWASSCICIAVDAMVIAADLKVSERRLEELTKQLALHKTACSQILRKLDENHTLMLEIRTRLANNNDGGRPTFQQRKSPKKNDAHVKYTSTTNADGEMQAQPQTAFRTVKSTSFEDIYSQISRENDMLGPPLGYGEIYGPFGRQSLSTCSLP